MYQHYLFDLYGTLVDIHTNEQKAYLWKKMALYFGLKGAPYEPKELKSRYHALILESEAKDRAVLFRQGHTDAFPEIDLSAVFWQLYAEKGLFVSDQELNDTARLFRSISLERLEVMDGVFPLLERLRQAGKQLFLLSNAQECFTLPELSLLGLAPYFDGILLSSQAGIKKPDCEFFKMLLSSQGLSPKDCLMIGNDDLADCHGATLAGIDSLYLPTRQSPPLLHPLPSNCRKIKEIREVF